MGLGQRARSGLRKALGELVIARRLPADAGGATVYLSPASQLRFLRPGRQAWESQLLTWAAQHVRPGMDVWDIGANSGVFTMAAAARGARVLAVEPDPFLANTLLKTVGANEGLTVDVLATAISDAAGVATLNIASTGRAANSLTAHVSGQRDFGSVEQKLLVPTMRLDDLVGICRPDLIKIDVEGAEVAVLRGARMLLREVRPTIIAEINKANRPEAYGLLREAGYTLADAATGGPLSEDHSRDVIATAA